VSQGQEETSVPHFEFGWHSADGLQFYAQGWQPETNPRACVCLVHGLGEHSGRYALLAAFLQMAGIATLAFDLRGHGKSGGQRGHAPSYEVQMNDLSRFLQEASARFQDRPLFLYGHSLGGTLAINYVLNRRPLLAGVIATGPAFRPAFKPPSWKITIGKIMYNLWPTLSMGNELNIQFLSRDPEVLRAREDDPLVHDRITARFGMDLLQSGLWAMEHAAGFPLPLLLMHGGADRITSVEASWQFARLAGGHCQLKIWDGLYHEIHNEPEKQEVFDDILAWLGSHVTA
jgi:alpha-beta hydrolase superfamily lysophospholipase